MKIIDAHLHLFQPSPRTDAMAQAVGSCGGRKFLVPMNNCGVVVAGVSEGSLSDHAAQAVEALAREAGAL